jgi:hypothetical protein
LVATSCNNSASGQTTAGRLSKLSWCCFSDQQTLFGGCAGVIDFLLELHHSSQHIVQQVAVGSLTVQLPELLQAAGQEVGTYLHVHN